MIVVVSHMNNQVSKKLVVIIGGAGLLGRSFCISLAEQGLMVIVADSNISEATKIAKTINSSGIGSSEPFEVDITKKTSVLALIAKLVDEYGRIDAVVNSAYPKGPNYGRLVEDVTYEDFCKSINLHLGGYFLVAQQFGIFFKEQGYGNFVNLASIYSFMPPRFDIYAETNITMPVEYAAIKAGVLQLTRYFANYYKGAGIRFNCLSPGGVLDGQDISFRSKYDASCNSKGMLEAHDLVGALMFLLSDASKYVIGQNIVVDDGFTL